MKDTIHSIKISIIHTSLRITMNECIYIYIYIYMYNEAWLIKLASSHNPEGASTDLGHSSQRTFVLPLRGNITRTCLFSPKFKVPHFLEWPMSALHPDLHSGHCPQNICKYTVWCCGGLEHFAEVFYGPFTPWPQPVLCPAQLNSCCAHAVAFTATIWKELESEPSQHAGSVFKAFWLWLVMAITASVQPESGRIIYAWSDFPHLVQLPIS